MWVEAPTEVPGAQVYLCIHSRSGQPPFATCSHCNSSAEEDDPYFGFDKEMNKNIFIFLLWIYDTDVNKYRLFICISLVLIKTRLGLLCCVLL